jgi:hypoxanthine phosphoribosyltransferase
MNNDEFFPLTWEHYGIIIEDLWKDLSSKLTDKNIKIDAIVTILREGAFTALPLAYKLNTYKVLTIQYKYMLNDGSNELRKISDLSKANFELPEHPIFLLCDTFPCGGKTKFLAMEEIKKVYPTCKFVFASLIQDLTVEKNPDVICAAFGFDIDENWHTTHPLFKKLGIEKSALNVVLPWENKEEEEASVNMKAWEYK